MFRKFGADGAGVNASADAADARSAALLLMTEALAFLDSDSSIPAVIGAQLQSAIDALWVSAAGDEKSIQLH